MDTRSIDIGKAVGYGWTSVKKDLGYFVGLALVVLILGNIGQDTHAHPSNWSLIGFLLSILMTCGYTAMLLSYQAGKKLPFENLFTNFKPYWRVLGASLLVGLITGLGLLLLIVPGFYWALRYQMTVNLIIDKNLSIGDAMRQSASLTQGKKMSLLGFDFVCLGIIILGAICLGVGILVAIPVVWLAGIVVYRQLGQPTTA